jgi:integrase
MILSEYNKNPYDISMSKMTFAEIYGMWYAETFDDTSNKSTAKNYSVAYARCGPLYDKKMADIKRGDLQRIIDDCPKGYKSVGRIKGMLNRVYKYCEENEWMNKNPAKNLKVPAVNYVSDRHAFAREHIDALWERTSDTNARLALMLIYSGLRIGELLNMLREDVNLDEQWMFVRKSKTDAGVRTVPIADKVLPFWRDFERIASEWAVCKSVGEQIQYDDFRRYIWYPLMKEIRADYTIHETRHTCNSLLIIADVNPTMRKKIMGHVSQMDIGESVYGHIPPEELLKAINKIC